MPPKLEDILAAADWDKLVPKLVTYADSVMRRYIWRGLRPTIGQGGRLLTDSKSADDYVNEAVDALLGGDRTYNHTLTLEQNLKGTIESRIWNWKKKSDRRPLVDHGSVTSEDGQEFDPVMAVADPQTSSSSQIEINEKRDHQEKLVEEFKDSIADDSELLDLLEAYEAEFIKPAEIESLTGIPAARVYELKRKLQSKMTTFMINHPSATAAGLKGE